MPSNISAHRVRVQRLVLAGGPGEVPAVEEDVVRVDHGDGLLERHGADVGEVVHALGGGRIVEQGLHGVGLGAPGADGVVVDRWTGRGA